nr:hypothetical protein [Burkholderiales bacterium]
VEGDRLAHVVAVIKEASQGREEFVSGLEGETPIAGSEPVYVSGATVFLFEVERYEAI